MKKHATTYMLSLSIVTTLAFSSCLKEELQEENEEEVITTMLLTFVPEGGGSTLIYSFDDVDGPGGSLPTQDSIILSPNKTYQVTIQLLNKTLSPAEDVTMEVAEEPEAHRFYYVAGSTSNISVSGLNNDPDGNPLGITSSWTTGAAANGSVKVVLRHYPGNPPNKEAADAVNSAKSTTDAEIDFITAIR